MALMAGVVTGLLGVLPQALVSTENRLNLPEAFLATPVQAAPASVSTTSHLDAWPELFDAKASSSLSSVKVEKKPVSGRSLITSVKKTEVVAAPLKQADPPKAEPPKQPLEAPVQPAVVNSTPGEPVLVASAQPVSEEVESEEGTADDLEEETEVTVDSEEGIDLSADSCDEESPAEDAAPVEAKPAAPPAKNAVATSPQATTIPSPTGKRKGYTIKPVGDDLVVYDGDGKEIYRKTRNSAKAKPTITKQSAPLPKIKAEPLASEQIQRNPDGSMVFVEVQKGDNPSAIAKRYPGLTAERLMQANGITNPSSLQIGMKLWIPSVENAVCHRVEEGETLSELVKLYEIDNLFEVCDLNGLSRTQNELVPGTVLVLPGAKAKPQTDNRKKARAITYETASFKNRNGWSSPLEGDLQISSPYGLRIDPFSYYKQKPGVAAGGGTDGRKRSFHHGIDFTSPVGTPVRAAREGEVVKVSISRWGHGKMVELQHEDGWFTVYSHNSQILVKVGDKVKQGDVISLSGNTGRSTGPHLHFEIRRPDQSSVDPRLFMDNKN
jgi:murein DD-endopeptidase MepM/ murein hydrolase activator NlpD